VTSSDVRLTSSVDASSWQQVDCDVNNNNVSRSSSTFFGAELTAARPADTLARWPFDVAGGLHWWSTPLDSRSAVASARPSPLSWQGTRAVTSSSVTSSSARRSSTPSAAAAESVTATDDDVQCLWWSPSPHSDVSASGLNSLMTLYIYLACI